MNNSSKLVAFATIIIFIFCINTHISAQQNGKSGDADKILLYKTTAVWKEMINDPNTNYFEVQKAFDLFWEGKELPLDENDIIGEKHRLKNNFFNRTLNPKELKEQRERDALAFECKKYYWWLQKTEPFIHDDGSIMTTEERLAIWKKHYEEMNEQNTK